MEQTRSLFNLPVQEITFEDIQFFCEQKIAEGRRLDYKKELPNDISKTIAAMGNTDGGIILVGVEEEKEREKGRRSFPGQIVGIQNEKNVKQSVINKCYSSLQPVFDLQIHEVSMPNKIGYSVIIIRVEIYAIPSFPVFHHQDKAIYVRLDDQTQKADLDQIKHLFERANSNEIHQQNYMSWINYKIPRLDEFTWCTVGVALPKKSFAGRSFFNSEQVLELNKAVEKYKLGAELFWIHEYCPLEAPVESSQERALKRRSTFKYKNGEPNSPIVVNRQGDQGIRICPGDIFEGSPDPKKGERFNLQFDAQGFMLGSVGFPKETDSVDGVRLWGAIHAILNFFCSDPIRKCYIDSIFEETEVLVFFEINNIPNSVSLDWQNAEQISDPHKGRIIWGGPRDKAIISSLNQESSTETCREFMGRFLASEGYVRFEEELGQFDFKRA